MKLIITDKKIKNNQKYLIGDQERLNYIDMGNRMDGASFNEIYDYLERINSHEDNWSNTTITADTRFLLFVPEFFKLRNVYLYNSHTGKVLPIERTISKELRDAHNLMKMYHAGAFNLEGDDE